MSKTYTHDEIRELKQRIAILEQENANLADAYDKVEHRANMALQSAADKEMLICTHYRPAIVQLEDELRQVAMLVRVLEDQNEKLKHDIAYERQLQIETEEAFRDSLLDNQ